ncbi:Integrase core domain-containing protein [Falsiroseomonas stagni DSM 19981]|uniref:Integrase core domain-containing protein n=1 Tax=Falsiroseomonas stagni DSM 19981 TaxID=1123062 RepID=A0A1I4AHD8_9PROT|nr:Integrase core domain-containing protein [Falsiroseomonas stagni DSM 19981]
MPGRPREPTVPRTAAKPAWVSDFTCVATWRGNAHVAFVIDTVARRIVGWRGSRTAHAGFVLDAPAQAPHDRRPVQGGGLVHHSDRLAEAGIEPSVGRVGDSCDNAMAESVIGLFKTEVIRRRGPWRGLEGVEFATLEWVDCFNNRRLPAPIGNIPPTEAEARCFAAQETTALPASLASNSLRRPLPGHAGARGRNGA